MVFTSGGRWDGVPPPPACAIYRRAEMWSDCGASLRMRGAEVNPARSHPSVPVRVGAEHVDRADLPENLTPEPACCLHAVSKNDLPRADAPHSAGTVDDLCRCPRNCRAVRRGSTAGAAATRRRRADVEPPVSNPLPPIGIGTQHVHIGVLPKNLTPVSARRLHAI